ncbi:MAG: hypothetical protein ACK5ME_09275 [Parahaliea sp.]
MNVNQKISSACSAILMAASIYSPYCNADILGVWKIDMDMTLDFNGKYAQLKDPEVQFLKCFSENSSFDISEKYFVFSTNEHTCSIAGNDTAIDSYEVKYEYRTLYENDEIVVLVSALDDGADFSQILHKINDELMWVYYSGESPEYDSHIRYYYKKIKSANSDLK